MTAVMAWGSVLSTIRLISLPGIMSLGAAKWRRINLRATFSFIMKLPFLKQSISKDSENILS